MSKTEDWIPKDSSNWFETAKEAALKAGEIIKQNIDDRSKNVSTKINNSDLVTEIDKKSEDIIINIIKTKYPNHKIIAEESYDFKNGYDITDEPTWFIDPIDGTTNFYYGYPYCSISIGIRYKKISIIGIVYNPISNELYSSIYGQGSYLNNQRISVSKNINTLKDCLIISEFGYDRTNDGINKMLERFSKLLLNNIRGFRMFGCCSLNICQIACGKAQIYYEGMNEKYGPKPWDFTAGEIILKEAGGLIILPEGKPFDCTKGRILCASNQLLIDQILKLNLYSDH